MASTTDSFVQGIRGETRLRLMLALLATLTLMIAPWLPCCHADALQVSPTAVPAAPITPADRVTFAFGPSSTGQMLTWVWLNGTTPARFVLDTGSNCSAISDTMAAKIGLTPQPSSARIGGKQALMVMAPMLQVGTIRYPDAQMVVVNAETLSRLAGSQADGVLGVNVLAADPVFIDFQKRTATLFYDTPVTPDQLRSLGMEGALAIPLTDHNGDLKFDAVVQLASGSGKASASLTVDTGGTDTVISEATARALGLRLSGPTHSYGGLVSDVAVSDVPLSSISFGLPGTGIEGMGTKCVRGAVPDGFPLRVGLDVLSHFQVLIDFGAKKMYLKPVSAPSAPVFVPLARR